MNFNPSGASVFKPERRWTNIVYDINETLFCLKKSKEPIFIHFPGRPVAFAKVSSLSLSFLTWFLVLVPPPSQFTN